MLVVVFEAGDNRYGLDIARVVEVVPMVELTRIPHTPVFVAGVGNYRGAPVPVIDLPALLGGRACRPLISARIMLVDYQPGAAERRLLGLLAEGVTATKRVDESALQSPGVRPLEAGYLGDVALDDGRMIQLIGVDELLPDTLRSILFVPEGNPEA